MQDTDFPSGHRTKGDVLVREMPKALATLEFVPGSLFLVLGWSFALHVFYELGPLPLIHQRAQLSNNFRFCFR